MPHSLIIMIFRIEEVPPIMDTGDTAFYFNGSPDGSRPGVYYIGTSHLDGM